MNKRDVLITRVHDLLDCHPQAFKELDEARKCVREMVDVKLENELTNERSLDEDTFKDVEENLRQVPKRLQRYKGTLKPICNSEIRRFKPLMSARLSHVCAEIETINFLRLHRGDLEFDFIVKADTTYSSKEIRKLFCDCFLYEVERCKIYEDHTLRNLKKVEINSLAADRLNFWLNTGDLRGHLLSKIDLRHFITVKSLIYSKFERARRGQ